MSDARARRRKRFALAAVFVSLAVAVVAAEVGLRVLGRPLPVRVGWRSFRTPYPALETNQLGFRGQRIDYDARDYVVVLLGDSQVQAKSSAFEWMPERRLQHYLRELTGKPVVVLSVGTAAWGQDQQLLALREYFANYRADRVVAWLTTTNDVKDNTWPTSIPLDGKLKSTFWLEDGQLRGPNHPPGVLTRSRSRLLAMFQSLVSGSRDRSWAQRYLPGPYQPLQEHDGPARSEWQQLRDRGLLNPQSFRLGKSDRAMLLTPRSARMHYGIVLTNLLLHSIAGEAASHDAEFTLFGVDKGDRTAEIDGVYEFEGNYYRVSAEQYNQNVRDVTEGLEFELIPVREPLWQVGPLDHHLNEHANDGVMRLLAKRLAKQL